MSAPSMVFYAKLFFPFIFSISSLFFSLLLSLSLPFFTLIHGAYFIQVNTLYTPHKIQSFLLFFRYFRCTLPYTLHNHILFQFRCSPMNNCKQLFVSHVSCVFSFRFLFLSFTVYSHLQFSITPFCLKFMIRCSQFEMYSAKADMRMSLYIYISN